MPRTGIPVLAAISFTVSTLPVSYTHLLLGSAVLTGGDASALGDGLSCGAVLSRSLLQPDRDKASSSARMPAKILYFRFIFIFSV